MLVLEFYNKFQLQFEFTYTEGDKIETIISGNVSEATNQVVRKLLSLIIVNWEIVQFT